MKKRLLALALFALPLAAFAQLPNGSTAPNFTATDIYGVQHNLYNYLDAGKPVFLDISATWCGPCWSYHQTHALDDFYFAFGPGGSNEAVVLFVEGDNQTTNNDLHGTGNNTQGDWVGGTYLPIIESGTIANLMQITYFPTVYRICPDRTVTETGAMQLAAMRNSINNGCGSGMQGTPNQVRLRTTAQRFCGPTGSISFTYKNLSNAIITNTVINLLRNGEVIATENFNTNIAVFGQTTFNFNNVDLSDGADNLEVEVASVNGNAPFNTQISRVPLDVEVAQFTTNQIQIQVHLDNYAEEASWQILNQYNQVVVQGGPYAVADRNTTKTINATLPDAPQCYRVRLIDSYGDGWGYGNTPHGMTIKNSSGETIFSRMVSNFGNSLLIQNAFHTDSALGNDEFVIGKGGLYPNPSTGIFHLASEYETKITVTDLAGKIVWSADKVTTQSTLDLSHLSKGIYLAQLENLQGSETVKIVLK